MRDKEKEFISECAASATWLIKSLDQRARTILKVASEIVRQQAPSSRMASHICDR